MARDFPSSSASYLNVGDVAAIDITGTALTISVWVNIDTAPVSFGHIIAKAGASYPSTFQYVMQMNGSGQLQMAVFDSGGEDVATVAGDVRGAGWVHACGRKNGTGAGAVAIFRNGTVATNTSNRSMPNTAAALRFGNSEFGSSSYIDGRLAEIGIWNVALNDDEIASLAKGFSPCLVRPQSLRGYWPLSGNDSPEPDLRESNSASINGTVAKADHPRIIMPREAIYITA